MGAIAEVEGFRMGATAMLMRVKSAHPIPVSWQALLGAAFGGNYLPEILTDSTATRYGGRSAVEVNIANCVRAASNAGRWYFSLSDPPAVLLERTSEKIFWVSAVDKPFESISSMYSEPRLKATPFPLYLGKVAPDPALLRWHELASDMDWKLTRYCDAIYSMSAVTTNVRAVWAVWPEIAEVMAISKINTLKLRPGMVELIRSVLDEKLSAEGRKHCVELIQSALLLPDEEPKAWVV